MDNNKKTGFIAQFKELIGVNKISLEEAVEVAKIATDSAEVKFKDVMVGDKVLRIEGEDIIEGAAVVWYNEDESMDSVPDGEYEVAEVGTIVIKDEKISEIKPAGVEEAEEDAEVAFDAETSYKEVMSIIGELKSTIEGMQPKSEEVDVEAKFAEMEAKFEEQLKSIPAYSAEGTKHSFSSASTSTNNMYRSTRK